MRTEAISDFKAAFTWRVAAIWQSVARWGRFHAVPLAIVLVMSLGCQAIVLAQGSNVVRYPDTTAYIIAARELLSGNFAPDVARTPGYPLFLAAIFWVTRSETLIYVVGAQAALLVIGALEIYALSYMLSGRRWIGALIASLIGGNIYYANWSRPILSEALTTWLIISVMLCFAVYARRASHGTLALLALLVIYAVFTRPQLLYLPAILLVALGVRALRQRDSTGWRGALLRLWPAAAGLMSVYALVLLYMVAFWMTYGAFTTTSVSNLSQLGMILRLHNVYNMPYTGADPQYDQLRAQLLTVHGDNPVPLINAHPAYEQHAGRFYGAFASEVLRAHPTYVIHGAYDAFVQTTSWDQRPSSLAPLPTAPHALLYLSQDISLAYACLPLLLIASLLAAWRNPGSPRATVIAALMLVVVAHIGMGVIGSFASFDRLRMPVDWAMLTVTVLAITQLFGVNQTEADASFTSLAGIN